MSKQLPLIYSEQRDDQLEQIKEIVQSAFPELKQW